MGDTTALESESTVVDVMFLLRNGLLAAGRLEAVAGAMLLDLDGSVGPGRGTPCSGKTTGRSLQLGLDTPRWEIGEACCVTYRQRGAGIDHGEEEKERRRVGVKTEKKPKSSFRLSRGLERKIRLQWVLVSRGSILCDLLGRGRFRNTTRRQVQNTGD
jgi:hypothetical protein